MQRPPMEAAGAYGEKDHPLSNTGFGPQTLKSAQLLLPQNAKRQRVASIDPDKPAGARTGQPGLHLN